MKAYHKKLIDLIFDSFNNCEFKDTGKKYMDFPSPELFVDDKATGLTRLGLSETFDNLSSANFWFPVLKMPSPKLDPYKEIIAMIKYILKRDVEGMGLNDVLTTSNIDKKEE